LLAATPHEILAVVGCGPCLSFASVDRGARRKISRQAHQREVPSDAHGTGPKTIPQVAFDVSDSTAPKFVSDFNVGGEKSWQGTGRGFAADGLVYLSHSEIESKITGTNYYVVTNRVVDTVTNVVTFTNLLRVPQYTTVTNYEPVTNIATVKIRVPRLAAWRNEALAENHVSRAEAARVGAAI